MKRTRPTVCGYALPKSWRLRRRQLAGIQLSQSCCVPPEIEKESQVRAHCDRPGPQGARGSHYAVVTRRTELRFGSAALYAADVAEARTTV
jgi:hypothetical protein